MNKLFVLTFLLVCAIGVVGQEIEPEFIGEAFFLKPNGSTAQLDKEIADLKSGISWAKNAWNAISIEIPGGKAQTRFRTGEPLQLVVRAVDNNSDPLTIVSIYKFKAKTKSRSVIIGKDDRGTPAGNSRTYNKVLVRFSGKKYGKSSYLIALQDLEPAEYGIVVTNPNNRDEKRVVVSSFGID